MKKNIYILIILFILLFSERNLYCQRFNHAYLFGSTGSDYVTDLKTDSQNNIIIVGSYSGTLDLDPGVNQFQLSSIGTNAFVAKYTQAGEFIWGFGLNNVAGTSFEKVEIDINDNIIVMAIFSDGVDLDPGPNLVTPNIFNGSCGLIKYDKNGNYIAFMDHLGINGGTTPAMTKDKDDNIYVFNTINFSIDIDPSSNVQMLNNIGGLDTYVSIYNSNLGFIRAFKFGGNLNEYGRDIYVDSDKNIYLAGTFEGTVDFDPSVSVVNRTATNDFDGFLAKYSFDGNLIFVNQYSGDNRQEINNITEFGDTLIILGEFIENIDTDPSVSNKIFDNSPLAGQDIWFGKYLSNNGELIDSWHLKGGNLNVEAGDILTDLWGDIYIGATLWGSINLNVKGGSTIVNSGLYEISLIKYSSDADLVWYGLIAGGEIDRVVASAIDRDYNWVIGGNIRSNPVNWNIQGGTNMSGTPTGVEDGFFASYAIEVPPSINLQIERIDTNKIIGRLKVLREGNSPLSELSLLINEANEPFIDAVERKVVFNLDSTVIYFEVPNLFSDTEYIIKGYAKNTNYFDSSNKIKIKTLPTVEDLGPNNGDGNGDGIKDSRQDNVLTLFNESAKIFMTIEDKNGYEVKDANVSEPKVINKLYLPFGLLEFKIEAQKTQVKVFYHINREFTMASYFKLQPNDIFYEFKNVVYDTLTINNKLVPFITLSLQDGGIGDYDGVVNGIIYDPGGPAVFVGALIPTFSEWVRIIALCGFVLCGAWWVRKVV